MQHGGGSHSGADVRRAGGEIAKGGGEGEFKFVLESRVEFVGCIPSFEKVKTWASVDIPKLNKAVVLPALHLTNSKSGLKEIVPIKSTYRMYVCGITPYDATHMGHAATYLTFDLLQRLLLIQGRKVSYV
ncbi:MAG: hypothetical protein EBW82_03045, partial [Verrucomicrobia bacterium]|nr:hypothetical protein [Verrucomicrobiota bacterium]